MNHKRIGLGCAVVNRLLYAIGGFDGHERLNSCECYHPENNEWTMIKPMKCARSGAGVAALGQFIYVVGGFDSKQQLSSVERYDTDKHEWEFVAPLRVARSALSLTALDGLLYAMGGFDGQSITTIVEVYDPSLNAWIDGVPLTSGRSGHAAAVIYQPSTIADPQESSMEFARDSGSGGTGNSCFQGGTHGGFRGATSGSAGGSGVGSRSGMFGGGGGGGSRENAIAVARVYEGPQIDVQLSPPECERECKCRITRQLRLLKHRFRSRRKERSERVAGNYNKNSTKSNLKQAFNHLFISLPSSQGKLGTVKS